MSTALKLLAGIVLASIFMGTFLALQMNLGKSNEIRTFKNRSQKLAEIINGLSDPNSQKPFEITIPEDCELRFENKSVVAVISGDRESHNTDLNIENKILSTGTHNLQLIRTEEGVRIDA